MLTRKRATIKGAETCKEQRTLSCDSTSASLWGKESRTGFTHWGRKCYRSLRSLRGKPLVYPAQGLLDVIVSLIRRLKIQLVTGEHTEKNLAACCVPTLSAEESTEPNQLPLS